MYFKARRPFSITKKIGWWFFGGGSLILLWASYSRSAALAMAAAMMCILFAVYGRRLNGKVWAAFAVLVLVLGGSLFTFKDTQFVSQVILHEDPLESGNVNSNDDHANSLVDGLHKLVTQPLGGGVGSTGSASLLGNSPIIIENYYLSVAHETGWLGLILFLAITYFVLVGLMKVWKSRRCWLALGVWASGVGIAVAGLFLPVWTDDTISIIWWGLAALALAGGGCRVDCGGGCGCSVGDGEGCGLGVGGAEIARAGACKSGAGAGVGSSAGDDAGRGVGVRNGNTAKGRKVLK